MYTPHITVLMPAHNASLYLEAAMNSILKQTFSDFEFLIIDDGSSDGSSDIIHSYTDSRIRVIHHKKNQGLIATLNEGIQEARGTYIARMDADDISAPTRLWRQISFMEAHPEVGIVGTWRKTFGDERHTYRYFTDHDHIHANLLFAPSIVHPSMMMRRSLFMEHGLFYDPSFTHVEDYALWCTAAEVTRLANIPKVLLYHRIHGSRVSSNHSHAQKEGARALRTSQIEKVGISPTEYELTLHSHFHAPHGIPKKQFLHDLQQWFEKLQAANDTARHVNAHALSDILAKRWFQVCNANAGLGSDVRHIYCQAPFTARPDHVSTYERLRFFAKTFIS